MATAIVSGRVDEAVRDVATRYIQAAGLTVGDVIKTVMTEIARTGEVPRAAACEDEDLASAQNMRAFMDLRASLPSRPALATLSDAGMREIVAGRYA